MTSENIKPQIRPARTIIIASEPGFPALAYQLKAGEEIPDHIRKLMEEAIDKKVARACAGIRVDNELSGF